jgi:hypothetical protein
MAKYIMVYKNNSPSNMSTLPKEEVTKMMDVWGEWLGSMGSALVEKGNAFKSTGKSITPDGVKDADNLLTGYSVIEAKNFDEALELAQNNPMVVARGGSIELYEAFGTE